MSKAAYKYVQAERTQHGRLQAVVQLSKGLLIGKERQKEVVLREATTGDLLDAEKEASASAPLAFSTALAATQIERIGSYDGPVTAGMLRELSTIDFARIREAQAELDLAGEIEQ